MKCSPRLLALASYMGLAGLISLSLASVGAGPPEGERPAGETAVAAGPASGPPEGWSPVSAYRKTWAIIIGVKDYEHLDPALYQSNDARAMYDKLRSDYGLLRDNICYLDNKSARKDTIEKAFTEWLPARGMTTDDALLVFFSGHGAMDDGKGYIAGIDSKPTEFNTWVSLSFLTEHMGDSVCKCRHKLLILNSCFSGSLFLPGDVPSQKVPSPASGEGGPGVPGRSGIGPNDPLTQLLNDRFFWGVTASKKTVVAADGGKELSLFTSKLIEVLDEQGDSLRPVDHVFGFLKLVGLVREKVAVADSSQVPDLGPLGPGRGDFLFCPTVWHETPGDVRRRSQADARERLIKLYVAIGNQQLEGRDPAGSLLYFAEAFRTDSDSHREPLHRLRLGTVAGCLPRFALQRVWKLGGEANDASFTPDGKYIVTASADGTAQVWEVTTGNPASPRPIEHRGPVTSASFHPDGGRLLTACGDGTARVWRVPSGELAGPPMRHGGRVNAARFSPDGNYVVTASADHTARLWDAATGKPVSPPLVHARSVADASFSPDGGTAVTVGDDKTIRVWHVPSGDPVGQPIKHDSFNPYANFNREGGYLVTPSPADRNAAQVWLVGTSSLSPQGGPIKPPSHKTVNYASLSPHGEAVVTGSEDKAAQVWRGYSGQKVEHEFSHRAKVEYAAFSPSGLEVVTISRDRWDGDHEVNVWDVATGATVTPPLRTGATVKRAVFGPDGCQLLLATAERQAPEAKRALDGGASRLWNARTGQPIGEPLATDGSAVATGFSPGGRYLITRVTDKDAAGTVRNSRAQLWEASTGKAVGRSIPLDPGWVESPGACSDGARLAVVGWRAAPKGRSTGGEWKVTTWDMIGGRSLSAPMPHRFMIRQTAFSRDGSLLATASGSVNLTGDVPGESLGEARVWDSSTGKPVTPPLVHAGPVERAVFSPDGKNILTGSTVFEKRGRALIEVGEAKVWEVSTGKAVGRPARHDRGIVYAAFNPDGTRFGTAAADGSVRTWDARTGEPSGAAPVHADRVNYLAFSADGRRLVTASDDRTARVWDATSGAPLSPSLGHEDRVDYATFGPDGAEVLTVSGIRGRTARTRLWNWSAGKQEGPAREYPFPVTYAAVTDKGFFAATANQVPWAFHGGTVWLFDASAGEPKGVVVAHNPARAASAAFDPAGRRVVTATGIHSLGNLTFELGQLAEGESQVWDAATGYPLTPPLRTTFPVTRAVFCRGGSAVLTVSEKALLKGAEAQLWDAGTGRPLAPAFKLGHEVVTTVDPAGRRLVTISARFGQGKKETRLWDVAAGKPIGDPLTQPGDITLAVFDAPAGRLLTASDESVAVRDAVTGAPVSTPLLHRGIINDLALIPGDTLLAIAEDGDAAKLYRGYENPDTGLLQYRLEHTLRHADTVTRAIFSPKGRVLVTTSRDQTARVWEVGKIRPNESLSARSPLVHQAAVVSATFSPNGELLATLCEDQTFRVWYATSGDPLTPRLPCAPGANTVDFSADNRRVVVTCPDGTTRVWEISSFEGPPASAPAVARVVSGQQLQGAEALEPVKGEALWQAVVGATPSDQNGRACARRDLVAWHGREAAVGFAAENWRAAIWHLDRLVALEPGRAAHRILRARAHTENFKFDKAAEDYAEAIRLGSDDWSVWLQLGVVHSSQDPPVDPEAEFAKAIDRGAANWYVWWERGSAVGKKNPQAALAAYTKVIELNPDFWKASYSRAGLYMDAKNWACAEADLSRVIELDPYIWQAYYFRGEVYARQKKFDPAIAEYTKALAVAPDIVAGRKRATLWDARGQVYYNQGRGKEAARDFAKVAEVLPDDPNAWYALGLAELLAGRNFEAEGAFSKVIQLRPDDWQAWYQRGVARGREGDALKNTNDWQKAVFDFSAVLDRNPPDRADVLARRGFAYGRLSQWNGAIDDYSAAVRLKPNVANYWYGRGFARLNLGHLQPAYDDLSKAIELDPKNGPVYAARGAIHARLGRWTEGIKDCTAALAQNAKDGYALRVRAECHVKLGQWLEVENDYALATGRKYDDWQAHAQLARCMIEIGQPEWAVMSITGALQIKEDKSLTPPPPGGGQSNTAAAKTDADSTAELLFWRGRAYAKLKKWKEAADDFARAGELRPTDAANWHALGLAHAELGQWADAVKAQAVTNNPNHKDAVYQLGLVLGRLGQWENAALAQSRVLGVDNSDWRSHLARANVYLRLGRVLSAARDYGAVAYFARRDWRNWFEAGRYFASIGRWSEAVTAYTVAIELGATDSNVWKNRGGAFSELDDWKRAVEDARAAIARGALDWETRSNLGFAQLRLGLNEEAVATFSTAIEQAPLRHYPWKGRGIAYLRLNKLSEARTDLLKASALGVNDPEVWSSLAEVAADVDQPADAEAACTKWIALKPDDGWSWWSRGLCRARVSRWKDASVDFDRARELLPDEPVAWSWCAHAQVAANQIEDYRKTCASMLERFGKTGDPAVAAEVAAACLLAPRAVSDYASVLQLAKLASTADAKNYAYVVTEGALLYRAGNFVKAEQRLKDASALKVDAVTAWLFLALTRQNVNKTSDAQTLYGKAAKWLKKAEEVDRSNPAASPLPWAVRLRFEMFLREASPIFDSAPHRDK